MTGTQNRGPLLQAVATALVILAVTSFCLRAYVRAYMVKAYGLDDWLMSLATITFILFVTCVITGVHYGTGQLSTEISHEAYSTAMKYWLLCYVWYTWTMILSKVSIGLFLIRIIFEKMHLWLIYMALFVNVLSGLAFFFVALLQCHPVSYFWDKDQDGHCISTEIIVALTYFYSVLNIIVDFTFAILPIVIVWGLNMGMKLKIATVPLLSMGCIASSAVVVRLPYVQNFKDPEFLYATTDIAIWSTVEAGLAVTAGSLACIRPLFRVVIHRLGWMTDVYHQQNSAPLPGGPEVPMVTPKSVSSPKRTYQRDMYNMSLFSYAEDDEDGSGSRGGATGSMTNLVKGNGIMKTSAFSIKVEERDLETGVVRGESSTTAGQYKDGYHTNQPPF